jgi:hypothetical protein
VPNEKPVISVEDMAKFLADSFTNEYRAICIVHLRSVHGDEYADAVRNRAWALMNQKTRKTV